MTLAVAFDRRRFWLGSRQQGAAQRELGSAVAVGEEPNMADAVEAIRHCMQQEPAQ